jgi:hypothetical protein
MDTRQFLRTVGGVAIGIVAIVSVLAGQGARSPDELLTEVRALRADMHQAASDSIRAQLLVARLQLQDQRVDVVSRQLAEVQSRLMLLQQEQTSTRERLRATEEDQARLPSEDRSDDQARALRLQLEQAQTREQALQTQESVLQRATRTEQAKWNDFNSRLDALERTLTK